MNTKNWIKLVAIALISTAVTFTACKKDNDGPGEDLKLGNDNAKVQGDMDDALADVEEAFSNTSLALRTDGTQGTAEVLAFGICGATVDTSQLALLKQITISFDGTTTCEGRIRDGDIVAKLIGGNKWRDPNAKLLITFNNFKVTYITTNQTFTYNGTKTLINETGGLVRNLGPNMQTVRHKVRGDLSVTFEDGTQRDWWVTRKNVYDYNGGNTRLTLQPDSLSPDSVQLGMGGTNRFGDPFTLEGTVPIVILEGCGWFKPVGGVRVHRYNDRAVTIEFGVNQDGSSAGGSCAYGYRVEWVRLNGEIGSAVIAY